METQEEKPKKPSHDQPNPVEIVIVALFAAAATVFGTVGATAAANHIIAKVEERKKEKRKIPFGFCK